MAKRTPSSSNDSTGTSIRVGLTPGFLVVRDIRVSPVSIVKTMLVRHLVVSTAEPGFEGAQRLRDTVNANVSLGECRLSREHVQKRSGIGSMASKKFSGANRSDAPPLPFDVTQEIDPALVEDLRPA